MTCTKHDLIDLRLASFKDLSLSSNSRKTTVGEPTFRYLKEYLKMRCHTVIIGEDDDLLSVLEDGVQNSADENKIYSKFKAEIPDILNEEISLVNIRGNRKIKVFLDRNAFETYFGLHNEQLMLEIVKILSQNFKVKIF